MNHFTLIAFLFSFTFTIHGQWKENNLPKDVAVHSFDVNSMGQIFITTKAKGLFRSSNHQGSTWSDLGGGTLG